MATEVCPVCGFVLDAERDGDEIVMTFNIVEWKARCITEPKEGPAQCAVFGQRILTLLTEAHSRGNGHSRKGP
jgi:hypothetical protein